jgi:RHS repeat-associated protein
MIITANTITYTPASFSPRRLVGAVLLVVSLCALAVAQSTSNPTDGSTPLGLAPGAPTGSYSLGGFDNVNLYSGSLNFHLPLLSVGGRGGAQYTMLLPIEQHWTVDHYENLDSGQTIDTPNYNWWDTISPGYSPGVLQARYVGWLANSCGTTRSPRYVYSRSHTRLTFTAADGTEYELVDQPTGGNYHLNGCATTAYSRGRVFTSNDGSAMTFISDANVLDPLLAEGLHASSSWADNSLSGYLLMRDGTRYRIDAGTVTWISDRNGNKLSFTYTGGVSTITDSLNRQVSIAYNVNDVAPYGLCDKVTFKGFGGATRTIRVSKAPLGSALKAGYSLQTDAQLFGIYGNGSVLENPTVVTSVWLPDTDGVTRRYAFYYNSYADLARVELPTGGAYEYDWAAGLTSGATTGTFQGSSYTSQYYIYRRIVERRVLADGINVVSRMTYSRPESSEGVTVGYVTVDEMDGAGMLLTRQQHYFNGTGAAATMEQGPLAAPTAGTTQGKEYQTDAYNTDGTTLLRHVVNLWEASTILGQGPHITETDTTLSDTNQITKTIFTYDRYGNQTDINEYDYGVGSPGTLARRAHIDYLTTNNVNGVTYDTVNPSTTSPDPAATIHIRSLPAQQQIFDASGAEKARINYEYDNYANDGSHAPLVGLAGISGLDAAFTTNYTTRGNVTCTTRWLLSTSTPLYAYSQYDIAGNVVKAIDPRNYATTFDYADRFGAPDSEARNNTAPIELGTQSSYAFPTSITNALNQTAYAQYDYYLGRLVNVEDINGVVSSGYSDNEPLDRPTKIVRAVNTAVQSQLAFSYDDVGRTVTTTSDLNAYNDNLLKSVVLYDGLGRTTETRQYETTTAYITSKQNYDALGRAYQVSNPYRAGDTIYWTTTAYDALGRSVSVTTPDNAVLSMSYSGNAMITTDQGGKIRRSLTDALGRLIRVDEPDASNNIGSVSAPILPTSYVYDVLDDLLTVTQGSQTRTFVYDSLKRLTSATNPESGTASYQYDPNGNLTQRINARNITTTISYDAINRPTSRTYNDNPATPAVNYYYDGQAMPAGAPVIDRGLAAGRLVAVTYGGGSAGTYRGYDQLGRAVRQIQQTDGVNYLVEAAYNKTEGITSETYPSVPGYADRRSISYSYDGSGRLAAMMTAATTFGGAASASGIGYAAHGAFSSETLGNGLMHSVSYNSRLQPSEIKLGTVGAPTSVLDLLYSYGTTNNNGNVQSVTYAGGGLNYVQAFTYDQLNRLATAQETTGTQTNWTQTQDYDRYGNRWVVPTGGGQSQYFDSNNRIVGKGYDADGDLISDGGTTYGYDAECRLARVNGVESYRYDGEGRRVRKLLGESTRLVYGIGGQLVAEFDGTNGALRKEYVYGAGGLLATIEPNNSTKYVTQDHLGTPRVVTNGSGTVVSRRDYFPFGEELSAGIGGRTTAMGFSMPDGVRQQFTGQPRDFETGLDFLASRYYSSTNGRFTSPDSFGGHITNPQTLNLYAYVLGNPLKYIDPSGHSPQDGNKPDKNAQVEKVPRPDVEKKYVVTVTIIYEDIVTSSKASTLLVVGNGGSVGPPGRWERMLPVWGNGRMAVNDFQTGHPYWGAFHTAMAVSDVFLVKSIVTSVGRLGLELAAENVAQKAVVEETVAESSVAVEESVTLFHGSTKNASQIAESGLDVGRPGATYVSSDVAAAQDAIAARTALGEATDAGIIVSKVPSGGLNSLIDSGDILVRPYSGFYPYRLNTVEHLLRTPAAKELFNRGIIR